MLPDIQKILFTSNLTESSKHAFSYATSLAGRYCTPMVFLYVMEEIPRSAKAFLDEEILGEIRRRAANDAKGALLGKRQDLNLVQSELERFCDMALSSKDVDPQKGWASEVVVTEGNVVDAIIQTADEYHCDAIVMGSKRGGALSEAVLGTVVKGVLRRSNRLVVIAPPLPKSRSPIRNAGVHRRHDTKR